MSSRRMTLHPPRRTEARRVLARASNTLALRATAHLDRVPPSADDWWHDLRRGKRWVWGGLLRFIDRSVAIGTPADVLLGALGALAWYVRDSYGMSPNTPAPA